MSERVLAVVCAPDSKLVLTTRQDQTAWLWDVVSSRLVRTLEGYTGPVWAVAWAPDGKQVLAGSDDNTARFWIAYNAPIIAKLTSRCL